MRIRQSIIDRYAVYVENWIEHKNAIYCSYDNKNRFNYKIINKNRFDEIVKLKNHFFFIDHNEMIFWKFVLRSI